MLVKDYFFSASSILQQYRRDAY